jgi:hypothetical protein
MAGIALISASCSFKKQESKKEEAKMAAAKEEPKKELPPANAPDLVFPEDSSGLASSMRVRTTGKAGEEYVFEGTELVFPKDSRALRDAAMKGTGQLLQPEGEQLLLLTGGKVTSRAERRLSLQFADKQMEFEVDKDALVCDSHGPIALGQLAAGETVVVVSRFWTSKTATSVRRGPLLLKMGGPFGSVASATPVNYICREPPKKWWEFWK